jgi:hypothetical protein
MCGVDAEALGDAVRPMGSGSGMVGESVRRVREASKVDRRRGIGNTLVLNARPTARANGSQGRTTAFERSRRISPLFAIGEDRC